MNRSKPFFAVLSLLVAFVFFLGEWDPLLSLFGRAEISAAADESIPAAADDEGIVRPEDLNEGLSRKSFAEMEGRRVTLRQPVMEVTARNVERDKTELLSDIFHFIDPDTKEFYAGPAADIALIDFDKEAGEEDSAGDLSHPRYPMKGLNKGTQKNGEQLYFSTFVKYMLLRQAWYYRQHEMELAQKDELQKHPAADYIYGAIKEDAKAVTKRIVSDPIYRSPLTTGLYLAPGEVVTVKVEGLAAGQKVRLTTHQQDSLGYDGGIPQDAVLDEKYNGLISTERYFRYWDLKLIEEAENAKKEQRNPEYTKFDFSLMPQWRDQNQKVPCMGSTFELTGNGTFHIGSIYGGPLYLQPTDTAVSLEISGAVETPHFVLGVTTKEEFEESLRTAPGLIATLDVENGMLVGYAEYMAKCDDIEKLAYFWHSVFAINSSLNGREYNYYITMAYDMHVPAGEAVALNSHFCAQPYGWFEKCMNYHTLTTNGNWGTFHELGHVQAKTYGVNWGMCARCGSAGVDGEVWNNTLIVLMYSMLCNMDPRVEQVEHGEFTHPFTVVERSMKTAQVSDYHDFNHGGAAHFDQLSLYATLIHSFGPERFVDFFYTYNVEPVYCRNSRADFIYRIALVDHVNIFAWVNEYYHGNVLQSDFSEAQWAYLSLLPEFWPVAYRWANGVDGNETARKYDVDGKYRTVFDLSAGNFASPKPVKIVAVTQPEHGSIDYDEAGGRAVYTPPAAVTETDSFTIVVMAEGERLVTLNVNLRLNYRGTYAEVWKLDAEKPKNQSVDEALAEIEGRDPDRTEESTVAGKATFTAGQKEREYYHLRFRYQAAEGGTYTFYLRADDASRVDFRKGSEDAPVEKSLYTVQDRPNYSQNGEAAIALEKGESVYADCHLVNWGGKGYLYVGVKTPGSDKIEEIPVSALSNAAASDEELKTADAHKGWQPEFLDSIKNTSIDYRPEKTGWQIVSAPVADSREANGKDKNNLIDGKESTFYHTTYGSPSPVPPLPHTYILDCGKGEVCNYFEFTRRGNVNDKVTSYALYAAPDIAGFDCEGTEGYVEIAETTVSNIEGKRYTERFKTASYRYFKLVITGAVNSFTVLSELDVGMRTDLGQTVKPKNFGTAEGFEENAANGKLTAKGPAVFTFTFLGTGFDVFADTAPGYGTAAVTVDGEAAGTIDLNDRFLFNQCVFHAEDLPVREHTVRIEAREGNFNISFINVTYATPVEEEDYPSTGEDYGSGGPLEFPREWKTSVQDYRSLTRIEFAKSAPAGYADTFVRLNRYIRVYRMEADETKLAFVYRGTVVSPAECGDLFADCTALRELVFGEFDTSAMRGAVSMFRGCASLARLDLSGFQTQNTRFMGTMFKGCASLSDLDLSGFEVREGTNLMRIFEGCEQLARIHVPASFGATVALSKQFVDHTSKRLLHELTSENAGHIVSLHEDHVFEQHAEIPATCEETGRKAYAECPCGRIEVGGKEVTDASQLTVPAKGHDLVHHEGTPATCEEAGCKAYDSCHCGKLFVDGAEVTEESLLLPATGHTFGDWHTVKEPTATEEGRRERSCACGHTESEPIAPLGEEKAPVGQPSAPVGLIVGLSAGGAAILLIAGVVVFVLFKKKRSR